MSETTIYLPRDPKPLLYKPQLSEIVRLQQADHRVRYFPAPTGTVNSWKSTFSSLAEMSRFNVSIFNDCVRPLAEEISTEFGNRPLVLHGTACSLSKTITFRLDQEDVPIFGLSDILKNGGVHNKFWATFCDSDDRLYPGRNIENALFFYVFEKALESAKTIRDFIKSTSYKDIIHAYPLILIYDPEEIGYPKELKSDITTLPSDLPLREHLIERIPRSSASG